MHARWRPTARWALVLVIGALVIGLTGCFGGNAPPVRVIANGTVVTLTPVGGSPAPTGTSAPAGVAPIPFAPTAPPSTLDPAHLSGFVFPIDGACLPSRDVVMPNAPRAWRHGINEGVDFYNGDVCTPIDRGTAVRAMFGGVVTRADLQYRDLTAAQVQALSAATANETTTDAQALNAYGGRQVWIDHGNGVVTRYENLSAITRGIDVGAEVAAGQTIGAVGESGTPESVTAPGTQIHLHVEVWTGDHFLGQGQPADAVRQLYERLFSGAAPTPATPAH